MIDMPAPMPSAPWLTPKGDPAQDYLHGYGLGEQAASETAQLAQRAASEQAQLTQRSQQMQQQAQQTQRELDMQQQQQERQHLMDQQRLEITKSYHQQQAALGQQKIQQAAQSLQMKTQETARKSALMMQMQKEIDAGGDEVEVHAKYGPQLWGAGGAGYERALVEQRKNKEDQKKKAALPTPQSAYDKGLENMYTRMVEQGYKDLDAAGTKEAEDRANQSITRGNRGLNNLRYGASGASVGNPSGSPSAPAPSQSGAASGVVASYQDGKLVWHNQPADKGSVSMNNPAAESTDAQAPAAAAQLPPGLSIGGQSISPQAAPTQDFPSDPEAMAEYYRKQREDAAAQQQ